MIRMRFKSFFALLLAGILAVTPAVAAVTPKSYTQTLVAAVTKKLPDTIISDTGKIQWVYDYLVENTWISQPVGMDCWQWRGDPRAPVPGYLETRAISPLAFGLGSCEDYAAALVLLLRDMGFVAGYLPGITISVEGEWVDHAWVTVSFGGDSYHLDPQLEDNVTRGDLLNYRYFLKTDSQMSADHRWGENLLQTVRLTAAQQVEVRKQYLFSSAGRQLVQTTARRISPPARPSRAAAQLLIQKERADFLSAHGVVEAKEITATPPVFGNEGYGAADF